METKHCHKCDRTLFTSEFYRNKARNDGLATACKSCHKLECIEYRHRHTDRVYKKELDAKTLLKIEVFSNYCDGEVKCSKCGFDDLRALSIDHIDGNGANHRRAIKRRAGTHFYRWVRDNKYPKNFQVLCMNCQWIKRAENKEYGGAKSKKSTN